MIRVGDLVRTNVKDGVSFTGVILEINHRSNVWSRKDRKCKPQAIILACGGREITFLLDDLELIQQNKSFFLTN